VDVPNVAPRSAAAELAGLLDSPEIASLICDLQATRWTGRPGYPIRAMVGMALAKSMYAIPTWTRTARLVAEHAALRAALGCEDATPSEWACYRFTAKLRAYKPLLDSCITAVLDRLREANPGMGENIAIDGSDLPAYANGQRYVSKNGRERAASEYSDPDASWGHRSCLYAQGRRVLRLQGSRRRRHAHGPSDGVDGRDGKGCRDDVRARPARRGTRARVRRAQRDHGQGV
jgi:hypothetical protein